MLGLAVLALLHTGHGRGALAALVASLCVMLALVRNVFGVFLVLTVGAVLYLVFMTAPEPVQTMAVGVFAWTLLFGAVRQAVGLLRFGGGTHSDIEHLEAITRRQRRGLGGVVRAAHGRRDGLRAVADHDRLDVNPRWSAPASARARQHADRHGRHHQGVIVDPVCVDWDVAPRPR